MPALCRSPARKAVSCGYQRAPFTLDTRPAPWRAAPPQASQSQAPQPSSSGPLALAVYDLCMRPGAAPDPSVLLPRRSDTLAPSTLANNRQRLAPGSAGAPAAAAEAPQPAATAASGAGGAVAGGHAAGAAPAAAPAAAAAAAEAAGAAGAVAPKAEEGAAGGAGAARPAKEKVSIQVLHWREEALSGKFQVRRGRGTCVMGAGLAGCDVG